MAAVFHLVGSGAITLPTIDRVYGAMISNALADLCVTGVGMYTDFRRYSTSAEGVFNTDPIRTIALLGFNGSLARLGITVSISDAQKEQAVDAVIDRALRVVWALHGPADYRVAHRDELGWLAVNAENDPPSRPVNIPAAAWPTRDLRVRVHHHGRITNCRMRYAVMGAREPSKAALDRRHLLPNDNDAPFIDPDDDVIVFIHGHNSRLEEATSIFEALMQERAACTNRRLALISFDLPNCGYSETIDHMVISPLEETHFVPDHPEQRVFGMLEFLEAAVVDFVQSLDELLKQQGKPGVTHRIAAVIGGSLGGNLALRLSEHLVTNPAWLRALVSWSPASAQKSLGRYDPAIPSPGEEVDPICWEVCGRPRMRMSETEGPDSRANFLRLNLVGERLIEDGTPEFKAYVAGLLFLAGPFLNGVITSGIPIVPAGEIALLGLAAIYWNYVSFRQADTWFNEDCLEMMDGFVENLTRGTRLWMWEVYTSERRRSHWRIAYEQLIFSHQDEVVASHGRAACEASTIPTLLIGGQKDQQLCFNLFEGVRTIAPRMADNPGRAVYLNETGHSVHSERPKWLARRIFSFLCERGLLPPIKDQLVVAPLTSDRNGTNFWALNFKQDERVWEHFHPESGYPYGTDLSISAAFSVASPNFGAKQVVAGNFVKFTSERLKELIIVPDMSGTAGNDLWAMRFGRFGEGWVPMNSSQPGHGFGANMNLDVSAPASIGVKTVRVGDFDGDGLDELLAAPESGGTAGNDFWVMKFHPDPARWEHLSPIPGHPFGADLNSDLGPAQPASAGVRLVVPGDFDGDGQDEVFVFADTDTVSGRRRWVMKFNRAARSWENIDPPAGTNPVHQMTSNTIQNLDQLIDLGTDHQVDLDIVQQAAIDLFSPGMAIAADVDGDGQEELILVAKRVNAFHTSRYDRETGRWTAIGNFTWTPFTAAGQPSFAVKHLLAADFDGDGCSELLATPDTDGTAGNDFWVMKYDRDSNTWQHLSPIAGHPFSADLNCDADLPTPTTFGVRSVASGDFDADGQVEVVVIPDASSTGGNDLWVMKFNPASRQWAHFSPIAGHPFGADLNCDANATPLPAPFGAKFAVSGDFGGPITMGII
jgi:pimeloyl-ACP methyl ester carboxylesterase